MSTDLDPVDAFDGAMTFYPNPRPGSPFSRAVRVGDVLYLSGQIGNGPDGALAATLAEQSRQTMENVAAALHACGSGMDRVFKCFVMLRDMSEWRMFNAVYLRYFDPRRLPARSAIGASALAAGALVELEVWAYAA